MNLKIIATALLLICSLSVSAQEGNDANEVGNVPAGLGKPVVEEGETGKPKIDVNIIYRAVEKIPSLPINFSRFLAENLKYPKQALKKKVQGKVVVQFVVERDGSLSDFKVVRGEELGHGLPEEAIRVMSTTPKWNPAIFLGVPVRSYFTIPIDFKLQ